MPQDGRMESEPTRRTFFKAALVPALAGSRCDSGGR